MIDEDGECWLINNAEVMLSPQFLLKCFYSLLAYAGFLVP